jgi:hypothetical protein
MTITKTKNLSKKWQLTRFWPALAVISLIVALSAGYALSIEPGTVSDKTQMVVYKTPACGCCDKWVLHLRDNDFDVKVNLVSETNSIRTQVGVPREMASCHTAIVGDYWVEGHVPADLIHKLLTEQPEGIKGIAVPGMPLGSPGMESPKASKYKVLSVDDNGEVEVYATRDGQNAH